MEDPNGSCLYAAGLPTETIGSQNFLAFSTRQTPHLGDWWGELTTTCYVCCLAVSSWHCCPLLLVCLVCCRCGGWCRRNRCVVCLGRAVIEEAGATSKLCARGVGWTRCAWWSLCVEFPFPRLAHRSWLKIPTAGAFCGGSRFLFPDLPPPFALNDQLVCWLVRPDLHSSTWSVQLYMIRTALHDLHSSMWSTQHYLMDTHLPVPHTFFCSLHFCLSPTVLLYPHTSAWSTHIYLCHTLLPETHSCCWYAQFYIGSHTSTWPTLFYLAPTLLPSPHTST